MLIFYILFFLSLVSIIFMVSRKLSLVKEGQVLPQNETHPFIPDLLKIKEGAMAKVKKLEHLILVAIVRFYVRSLNFCKNKYLAFRRKLTETKNKNGNGGETPPGEVSKFLKMISDYKQKIREIKHRIHEEENK
ncbi:hypothetical protein A3I95_01170 [Candidatus Nomurabacteria bacterium RIFCSPLOWO2_02_FULL_44_12]|uniref:Uncharacterized protein n=1 Tax=Candidatus Nomurabacteria bacterium RIFCSPLOWO2_12_FULL_44_11 TaxID=1801796 RepID=A0A1F6Y5K4_9BACT|nr:MAG: hypothetical protein A3E95_02880 [Candidatus Nomurabacteria bacterium RIFCSPHIGHO2_12_FULL_44_22b]OGJ01622.1 MAG: hypothetical protein A3G53_02565 [Candidatus Nomurabacteria bacterium RIFCSPLOWO2_12_FULL_44_11]OGJ07735.1 MAG: hypothetical protein A3I95_01170 [Candidatus Nomurabacteria bacterium RIFCSPLOWO2_02_FULL_44_12]